VQRRTTTTVVLGVAQTLGWASSYYLPAVLAGAIGKDIGISTSTVFGAFSVALLVAAGIGPVAGRRIDRLGGRSVLIASNLVFAAGLAALSQASSAVHVFAAWALMGLAMGSGLYEAAFARRQQNLIVVGPTGVGKTWLACAFGHQACRLKIPVTFYRTSDLYEDIGEAVHDGSLPKLKLTLSKPSLLILDDFGIGEMSASAAQVLLDVVDRRMRTGSLLLTSQYPTEKWHSFFPDPTIADAVLDRVVHQAHRIQLKGESMRKLQGRKRLEEA